MTLGLVVSLNVTPECMKEIADKPGFNKDKTTLRYYEESKKTNQRLV